MVAIAKTEMEAIIGVVLTSLSCGLGEQSLLAYSSKFNKYVHRTTVLLRSIAMREQQYRIQNERAAKNKIEQ